MSPKNQEDTKSPSRSWNDSTSLREKTIFGGTLSIQRYILGMEIPWYNIASQEARVPCVILEVCFDVSFIG